MNQKSVDREMAVALWKVDIIKSGIGIKDMPHFKHYYSGHASIKDVG